MFDEYCIGVIGVNNSNIPPDRLIFYGSVKYKALMDINITQLLTDIRHVPEFCLKPTTYDDGNTYLGVYFQPWKSEKYTQNDRSKYRIISTFFDVTVLEVPPEKVDQLKSLNSTSNSQNNSILSTSDLYSMLRDANQSQMNDALDLEVNIPNFFLPNLRSYQLKALQWMLSCEKITKFSIVEFVPIKCHSIPKQPFYFNPRTNQLMDYDPGSLTIPRGGILADEMGLGKTVEMLALIVCNPNLKRKRVNGDDVEAVVCKNLSKNQILKCICSRTFVSVTMIQCPECLFFQHEACVTKYSSKPSLDYLCPECWKRQPPIQSSTTLIVSPLSIKMQWDEEIKKHIFGNNVKVLIYDGIKSGWISPRDLAAYDVVLTDYTAMRTEIHFSNENKRQMVTRQDRRYTTPKSPLAIVHWWRVVLDEAQMVETPQNNCSRMVKCLPAENRWSVTGTPIEKSIDSLHGLMIFLDYQPFTDSTVWKKLTAEFNTGNAEPLINQCLKNVMWRTCKVNVWKEIGLPPQTEIIHKVTLSDLQAHYYSNQHSQCASAFHEKARKLDKSLSMFKLNPKTLKMLMEPLRKLRQDCTTPTIFEETDSQESATKKILLSPDELFEHMVSNNEHRCKEQLKIIAINLNGMAALQIGKAEFDIAIEMYESLLRWARDYTGNVCVDLPLQVHALHNLLEIIVPLDKHRTTEYSKELERLECKYFESTNDKVSDFNDKIKKLEKSQKVFEDDIADYTSNTKNNKFRWWIDYLMKIDKTTEMKILNEIRNKLCKLWKNADKESVTSVYTSLSVVIHVVSAWLDKIQAERKNMQKWFTELDFFTTNLKPRNVVVTKDLQKIDVLIASALHCHLDQERNKKGTKRTLCLLCKVNDVLEKYECLLFDKMYGEIDLGYRDPVPCYQEMIIEVIYTHLRSDDNGSKDDLEKQLEDGKKHRKLIALIKKEYKMYEKYWKTINLAAYKYDKLKMCKARLQVFDPLINGSVYETLKVSKYEVDNELVRFKDKKQVAERDFFKFWGILNYLKHLKNKNEPEECPICLEIPRIKYCILQCGHTLCVGCYEKMSQLHKTDYSCCVCRHTQKTNDFYVVTCKKKDSSGNPVKIAGNYSNKIEEIVFTALQLRKEEPDVKIIIFSQWETILTIISTALSENGLQYRSKSVKFNESIDDFKNKNLNITCLLLPLAYGSKGLNLTEATHVFLVEPILNPAEEFQAIGRIHRIGQTKPTFVHRFIVLNTIEESIFNTISNDNIGKWKTKEVTVENLKELFTLNS